MTRPGICLVIFLLIGLAVAETETNPVSLEIRQVPIVFGETAILFCNLFKVSGCCSNTVTWMRNHQVIVHHGVSVNAPKYKQIQSKKGFSLLITQFEYTDMRVKYSCLYKFLSASIYLEMDENKYEKHPKDKAVSQKEELNNENLRIYTINLAFEEVYPMPTCRILSDGYEFKTESHSLKNGMFNNALVCIKVNYTERNCGQNITGVCSVGKFNMTWSSGPPLNCYDSHSVASDGIETSVVIISTVYAIIIISTAVAVCYQKYKTKQKERGGHQEKMFFLWHKTKKNEHIVGDRQWFPRCSRKAIAKLVKENEMNFAEKEIAEDNTEINERRVYFYDLGKYLGNVEFHTIPQREAKQYFKDNTEDEPLLLWDGHEQGRNCYQDNAEDEPLLLWDGHEQGRNCYQEGHWFPRCSKKNFAKLVKENEMNSTENEIAKDNKEINERRVYFYDRGKYLKNVEFHTNPLRVVKPYCKDLSSNYPMQRIRDILQFLSILVQVDQWFPRCSKKNFAKLVKENEMNFEEKELAKNNTEINERRVYFYDRDRGKYLENIEFHTNPLREVKPYCKDLSSNYPMQRIRDISQALRHRAK